MQGPLFTSLLVPTLVGFALWQAEASTGEQPEKSFTITPIGRVREAGERTLIVLDKEYQPGLLGLDGCSHVHVIWWFDKNDTPQKRAILQVHPRNDEAIRSPACSPRDPRFGRTSLP